MQHYQVMGITNLTASFTSILMWATHWPLQPMDLKTAGAASALLVSGAGSLLIGYLNQRAGKKSE